MQVVNKLMMISVAVSDMPKAKEFYSGKLGLTVVGDSDQWVSLTLPEGGFTITLTTYHENMKPGTMKLYVTTSDITAAHQELSNKGVNVSPVKDDLYGPGSNVKWLELKDPDGNQVLLVQA